MISLEAVSKSFKNELFKPPKKVLDRVSFKIKKGSITGFLGANGAGKSTIIKLIMGFIKLDEGGIFFDESCGKDKIGFLPERPFFYPHLTGREFLTFLARLNDFSIQKKIMEYSRYLDLSDHLDKKIQHYSKGMVQRLGLIGCILHNPNLLILDEPLSGVDPLGRKKIKEILFQENDLGKTIFFSTHIQSDVEEICDYLVVLDAGTLKYEGSAGDLLARGSYVVVFSGKLGINRVEIPEEKLQGFLNEILPYLISVTRKKSLLEGG